MSILCKPTYVNTFQDAKLIGLDKSAIVLTAYGGTDIEVLGSVTTKNSIIKHGVRSDFVTFYIFYTPLFL